jgi:cAMP-dependent protein kinase regulator
MRDWVHANIDNFNHLIGEIYQVKSPKTKKPLRKKKQVHGTPLFGTLNAISSSSSDSSEGDETEFLKDFKLFPPPTNRRGPRESVSAEAFGEWNKKGEFKPRVISKTEDQKIRIRNRLNESFLFGSLEEKQKAKVIAAMEEKNFK